MSSPYEHSRYWRLTLPPSLTELSLRFPEGVEAPDLSFPPTFVLPSNLTTVAVDSLPWTIAELPRHISILYVCFSAQDADAYFKSIQPPRPGMILHGIK